MHYFITCYFNYCKYKSRERLTREFMLRNPNVHLIEVAYGDEPFIIDTPLKTEVKLKEFTGFINNKLINEFIKSHWENLESVTFIDSDIDLPKNFYKKVENKMNCGEPLFLQPFSYATDLKEKTLCLPLVSSARNYSETGKYCPMSHTGLMYCYNRAFLEKLGPKLFPESMLLGGFDTALHLCFTREYEKLIKLVPNENITEELIDFYKNVEGVKMDCLDISVAHYFHGNKRDRYINRFEKYANLSPSVIKSYFFSRNEDVLEK